MIFPSILSLRVEIQVIGRKHMVIFRIHDFDGSLGQSARTDDATQAQLHLTAKLIRTGRLDRGVVRFSIDFLPEIDNDKDNPL